jgi:ribosomal protein S25
LTDVSNQPDESFSFDLKPYSYKTIAIPPERGNILRIYGEITSKSLFGAPKLQILLVYQADKPPETLTPGRQRDVLREKAFHKKKVSASFEFEYAMKNTEPILLVFDNNHPVASRSAKFTTQIIEKHMTTKEKKKSQHPSTTVPAQEIEVPEKTIKRILGVLKSFQTVSMKELTSYSSLDLDVTRNIVFELIAEDQVTGRFDSKSDSFISASAASASRDIRSDQQSIARCMYCGNPLEKALKSGDEVKCPSCEMINVG